MKNKFGFSVPFVILTVASLTVALSVFRFQNEINNLLGSVLANQAVVVPTKQEISSTKEKTALYEEQIQNASTLPQEKIKNIDPTLVKSSFTDLFSGTGWINTEKTTLIHDMSATAFSYAPDITWEKTSMPGKTYNNTPIPLCIKNQCLFMQGENILFNNAPVKLPEEINKNPRTLSIGIVGERFLIFGTVQEGTVYKSYGFFFENGVFSSLCGESLIFSSAYKGEIGAGGNADNFLLVYGGYEGKGIQVLKNSCSDISSYFGIRIMSGGFSPRIIKAVGQWYIWSATPGIPRLIKLTEDTKTEKISGVYDFVPYLFPSGVKSVFFEEKPINQEPLTLESVVILPDNTTETWQFIDRGFRFQEIGTIVSKNINTNLMMKVREALITSAFLSPGDTDVELYLSNDGDEWSRTKVGDEVSFLNSSGNMLFWKAIFRSSGGKVSPPFFGQINIEYKAKP